MTKNTFKGPAPSGIPLRAHHSNGSQFSHCSFARHSNTVSLPEDPIPSGSLRELAQQGSSQELNAVRRSLAKRDPDSRRMGGCGRECSRGVSCAARCLDCLSHSGLDIFIHVPCGYRYVNASYGGTKLFHGSQHGGHLSRSRVRPLAFLRDQIRKRQHRHSTWPVVVSRELSAWVRWIPQDSPPPNRISDPVLPRLRLRSRFLVMMMPAGVLWRDVVSIWM